MYTQLWYGTFYTHQYKQSSRDKCVLNSRLPEYESWGSKHVARYHKFKN